MTDLFSNDTPIPAAVRVRDEPRYEHPRFVVGDSVRPCPEWRDAQTPAIPSGTVTSVDSFGLGQIVKVGTDPRFYVAGCFERDDGGAR